MPARVGSMAIGMPHRANRRSGLGVTNVEVVTVKEAMRRLSCGRSTIYRLMGSGALVSVTIRGSRRIRVDSVDKVASGGAA